MNDFSKTFNKGETVEFKIYSKNNILDILFAICEESNDYFDVFENIKMEDNVKKLEFNSKKHKFLSFNKSKLDNIVNPNIGTTNVGSILNNLKSIKFEDVFTLSEKSNQEFTSINIFNIWNEYSVEDYNISIMTKENDVSSKINMLVNNVFSENNFKNSIPQEVISEKKSEFNKFTKFIVDSKFITGRNKYIYINLMELFKWCFDFEFYDLSDIVQSYNLEKSHKPDRKAITSTTLKTLLKSEDWKDIGEYIDYCKKTIHKR